MSESRRTSVLATIYASAAVGFGAYSVINIARIPVSGWSDGDQIVFAVSVTFAVWTGFLVFALSHMLKMHLGGASSVPSISVPVLFPEQSDPDTWTQPDIEDGDRLLEADMIADDGEMSRVVVLVKPSGVVQGYSGPLNGAGLRLVMGPDVDLPPEPK